MSKAFPDGSHSTNHEIFGISVSDQRTHKVNSEDVLQVIKVVHAIRLILRISKDRKASNIRKLVVINIGVVRHEVDKSVNSVANVSVSKKIVESSERANVNFVKRQISVSDSFADFCRLRCSFFIVKAMRSDIVKVFI